MQTRRSIHSIQWLLLALVMLFIPPLSFGQVVGISITVAPPALPVYVQPICPGDNYIWTPGYWAYSEDDEDYYWVPGTWVLAPTPGYLWTPGYWGWNNGAYRWNDGYWGPRIGFYGGVNYGYGYGGEGYQGGYWRGDNFYYNRTVNNVNVTEIHNVYNKTVVNNYSSVNRASFNGPGGVGRRPTPQEETYAHEQHTQPTAAQTEHRHAAASDRSQFASVNHGKPAVAATARPGNFKGAGVVPAKAAAPYKGVTGKSAANARGAKTAGASSAARPSQRLLQVRVHQSITPDAQTLARQVNIRPQALERNRQHMRTQLTQRPRLRRHHRIPQRRERRALQKHSQSTRLLQKHSHNNTRLLHDHSHSNMKLLHDRSHSNMKLLQSRSHNTKLLQNQSQQHEAAPRQEPQHEATPRQQPQHEAAPKSEPQHEAAPKPQPQHEAAPKPQPQQHEAPKPQPQHEAAPKPQPQQHEAPKTAATT